jgi:hypothetical protein
MFFLRSHSFPNAQSGKLSFRIPQLPVAKPSLVEQFPAAINKFLPHQVVERDDVSAGLVLLRRLNVFHFYLHCSAIAFAMPGNVLHTSCDSSQAISTFIAFFLPSILLCRNRCG